MTKRFGGVTALDDVSMRVARGRRSTRSSGENGAGKSTLVKCLVGYLPARRRPDRGRGRASATIRSPARRARARHRHGLPALHAGAEHDGGGEPRHGARRRARRDRRLARGARAARRASWTTVPFRLDLDAPVARLAAGEKQKVEILKQLYLAPPLHDPRRADVRAHARRRPTRCSACCTRMTRAASVTVLMITHKFREVMAFADEVTVLRRGRLAGGARVARARRRRSWREMMVGAREIPQAARGARRDGARRAAAPRLDRRDLVVEDDAGVPAVATREPGRAPGRDRRHRGRVGQRPARAGRGADRPARAGGGRDPRRRRAAIARRAARSARCGAFSLPEEPLRNACVPQHDASRRTWRSGTSTGRRSRAGPWLRRGRMRAQARALDRRVRREDRRRPTRPSRRSPAATCSARCSRASCPATVAVLIAANPVFGLDFAAVAEIHARILAARNARRRRAAGERGPRRAARAVRPDRGDVRRAHRPRDRGRDRRHRRDRPAHGRPRRPRQDGVAARAAAGHPGSSRPAPVDPADHPASGWHP